jgi:dephospho-CoA kinase
MILRPHNKQVIAITGGIASGKSFVLECFAEYGFATFSSDVAAKQIMQNDKEVSGAIKAAFPEAWIEGQLDRALLVSVVFKDESRLATLEAILHPKIRELRKEFIANATSAVVCEIPLLFEMNLAHEFEFIIAVIAGYELQKQRALMRKNVTEERFYAILQRQVSDSYRIARSSYIIRTDSSKSATRKQVKAILGEK